MYNNSENITSYGKIRVGIKTLQNATMALGNLSSTERVCSDKNAILKALADQDVATLRKVSNYFYRTSGIYQRACNYFATMYRYDWYIVPENVKENAKKEEILKDFTRILSYLDSSYIEKTCGDIALEVIKNGAYYGYITDAPNGLVLQQLPVEYCRSRYKIGNMPAVEFNMAFFDEQFSNVEYRMRVLKMFPAEFAKGYMLYKQGKLKNDDGCTSFWHSQGWYLLEPGNVVKFNFNNSDTPLFVNVCPDIIDLDAAQALDRRKQMQKLLKILVQKLPLDKNGDLIFDVEEARDIHNNAVQMLRNAIGVDVLTTFTDVEAVDMADKNTATSSDDLAKVERTVYNSLGISQNLFNTDGNLSLEKSILNDEGTIRSLKLQFEIFFDTITSRLNKHKNKYNYRFYMLETTQYNYKELSKLYKEQMNSGFSHVLPQIALGHSQSSIINTAYFENEVLHLSEIMIPPLMSSTMKMEDLKGNGNKSATAQNQTNTDPGEAGRPEKPDDEKSDKTLANQASMG